jgi:hypothetical protein
VGGRKSAEREKARREAKNKKEKKKKEKSRGEPALCGGLLLEGNAIAVGYSVLYTYLYSTEYMDAWDLYPKALEGSGGSWKVRWNHRIEDGAGAKEKTRGKKRIGANHGE